MRRDNAGGEPGPRHDTPMPSAVTGADVARRTTQHTAVWARANGNAHHSGIGTDAFAGRAPKQDGESFSVSAECSAIVMC